MELSNDKEPTVNRSTILFIFIIVFVLVGGILLIVYFTEFCQAFHAKAATWFTRRLPPPGQWGQWPVGAQRRTSIVIVLLGLWRGCQFARAFAHGVSFQGNFIRVMDEPIQDGIG